jgi:hypothetical protein
MFAVQALPETKGRLGQGREKIALNTRRKMTKNHRKTIKFMINKQPGLMGAEDRRKAEEVIRGFRCPIGDFPL